MFAKHLNAQFCLENLLFLLELTQYKQQILKYHSNITPSNPDIVNVLTFSDTIPLSSINETIKNTNIESIRLCASKLIAKYITDKGRMPDFQVNISHDSLKSLFGILDVQTCQFKSELDILTLYTLFDGVGFEIYHLIHAPLQRFIAEYHYKMKTISHANKSPV
mmetsp:Transcript_103962/g.127035  ORF Transcript_103962/g.127035 Transcript_103962/m.127035 type:complete len:164 (+) Transcript_103962:121-612(+)